jgi:hypothetical protein
VTDDENAEDAATILRVKSVLRYTPAEGVFITLCQSMNKEHAINAGVKPHNIICMRELRLHLCAKSCAAMGVPAAGLVGCGLDRLG